MFFFLVGGVQPKARLLDATPRTCPRCGCLAARLQRIDSYLSLFFIPLVPVRRGEPVLACERCGYAGPPEADRAEPQEWFPDPDGGESPRRCPACRTLVESGFRYCPHCGQRL